MYNTQVIFLLLYKNYYEYKYFIEKNNVILSCRINQVGQYIKFIKLKKQIKFIQKLSNRWTTIQNMIFKFYVYLLYS